MEERRHALSAVGKRRDSRASRGVGSSSDHLRRRQQGMTYRQGEIFGPVLLGVQVGDERQDASLEVKRRIRAHLLDLDQRPCAAHRPPPPPVEAAMCGSMSGVEALLGAAVRWRTAGAGIGREDVSRSLWFSRARRTSM